MTYYSSTYNAHVFESEYQGYKPYTEGWESYPFSNITLEECAIAARKEANRLMDFAKDFYEGWANETGDSIRNRTLDEVMNELSDDLPRLEKYLYWWMVEAGDDDTPTTDPTDPQDDLTEKPLPQAPTEDGEETEGDDQDAEPTPQDWCI